MFTGVHGVFGINFEVKKAPRSSRRVLGCLEPRSHRVQNRVSLYILSRLKGIETWCQFRQTRWFFSFVYSFPFEGNWNCRESAGVLWRAWALYILSRLKGIETFTTVMAPLSNLMSLCIFFPVWRELKQRVHNQRNVSWKTLYILSRLKGIETQLLALLLLIWFSLYILSRLKGIETFPD